MRNRVNKDLKQELHNKWLIKFSWGLTKAQKPLKLKAKQPHTKQNIPHNSKKDS